MKISMENSLRIEWLEQQLVDKEEMLKTVKGQLESADSHRSSMESAIEDIRMTSLRTEERLSASACEIKKGNQIIERLQAELRSAKAKTKLKSSVIAQQETLLSEREKLLKKKAREVDELTRECDNARCEIKQITCRADEQRQQLEKSQALLLSNQQMIQWLNGQVNEAHLSHLGSGSKYSFRPSVAVPALISTGSLGV